MTLLHIGYSTTLDILPSSDISNNDSAYIWLNDYTRKMVYDSISTKAEDTTNHPYYIRPNDYSTGGVWIEEVGAEQPEAWNMNSIRTGELIIDDDGSIHSADKTSYGDTDPGYWIGYSSSDSKHQVDFGNGNSHVRWDGAAMSIRMSSGETFSLYGDLDVHGDVNVKSGGSIDVEAGGDITITGAVGDAAILTLDNSTNTSISTYMKWAKSSDHFMVMCLYRDAPGDHYKWTFGPTTQFNDSADDITLDIGELVYAGKVDYVNIDASQQISLRGDNKGFYLGSTFCRITQASSTGSHAVLWLRQDDNDEDFLKFEGDASAGDLTRCIVDEGDQGSETREGWLKVYVKDDGNQITDQSYFVPIYSLST